MSRATPKMRDLAARIIADEAKGKKSSGARAAPPFFPGEKLRPNLATLVGNVGFRSLLSRALALAGEEVPWLRAVHVKADGLLEGLEELAAKMDPKQFAEGTLVLLAQLLGLLVAFIGEILTVQLLLEVWPKASLHNFEFFEEEDEP